jgi:hypothetical protein
LAVKPNTYVQLRAREGTYAAPEKKLLIKLQDEFLGRI